MHTRKRGVVAADYGRNLYKQFEEALSKIDALTEDNRALRLEIRVLEKNHAAAVAALRAENRKEIKTL
ncbi:MAG: hypothetical protein LBP73_00860 [Clostridiales Family XIII bacterium]|jgi:hypothetical protein|nr:hypothetical protein [Clostridiales Family XIII bacterium]